MHRLILVSLLAVFGTVVAISEVNSRCIAENSEIWSNDNLIGTWYMIWKFTTFGGSVPFANCPFRNFTRPSEDIIQQYKNKYNQSDLPFNIDDNPMWTQDKQIVNGLLVGNNMAKFYVLTPNTTQSLGRDGYVVDAYRPLTPKYVMYTECALRGHTRWLMTKDRNAPEAELMELARNTEELKHLSIQKYCYGTDLKRYYFPKPKQ